MGIEVKGLHKKFGDYTAVDQVSFSMNKPGVFGLLGTNGAGKTTSIRMILGMMKKDNGTVLWNGENYHSSVVSTGYLAEERGIYGKATVYDQLLYFGELKGLPKYKVVENIDYWLERLHITEYKFKVAEQLSKGNQQKVQFIAALVADPLLLILDEPLSGLDPVNTDLFKEVIQEEITKGKYIIMSSHQMSTIEEFCSDLLILHKGKTVLQGNLRDIKKGYGNNHLTLRCVGDINHILSAYLVKILSHNNQEYNLEVENTTVTNQLLTSLLAQNIIITKFELREPTLHEIFIEKVGE